MKRNKYTGVLILASLLLGIVIHQTANAETNLLHDYNNLTTVNSDSADVYTVVDKMPEIVGGLAAVYDNIKYPKVALDNNVQGRVFVRFIVDENGNIRNPEILKDIGAGCGQAALKSLEKVKFIPGEQDGKKVRVYYSLPINFQIKG